MTKLLLSGQRDYDKFLEKDDMPLGCWQMLAGDIQEDASTAHEED